MSNRFINYQLKQRNTGFHQR